MSKEEQIEFDNLKQEVAQLKTAKEEADKTADYYRRWYSEATTKYNVLLEKVKALSFLLANTVDEPKIPF